MEKGANETAWETRLIEAAMYIALGFLSAGLLALAVLPAIYKRAVRLTREAMIATNPISYREVRAAQDAERARYAIALNRSEQALKDAGETAARYRAEAGQLKADGLRLKVELEQQLDQERRAMEAELTERSGTATKRLRQDLKAARKQLALTETELKKARSELEDAAAAHQTAPESSATGAPPARTPEAETVELATIAALESQIAQLKAQLAASGERNGTNPAHQIDTAAEALQKTVARLETELIEAETKYISAQAEVARLLADRRPQDTAGAKLEKKLRSELKEADDRRSSLVSELQHRDRLLQRALGQIERLRGELRTAPELAAIRTDMQTLVKLISNSPADALSSPQKPDETANQGQVSSPAGNPVAGLPDNPATTQSASALVKRIMKAQRASAPPPAHPPDQPSGSGPDRQPEKAQAEAASVKTKNKDVA
ncbi:hypothetical protein [Roseibium sp. RKSG952]|uniref:hypothetical protein n=1 Tax=Roseibium sp. RKSG952 TaxID=2529384 RepID=UPI0012BBAF85|nr:hypothetical protein [Roseibium sp. RKSG952]MTH95828.1 hypothetical protein [Roseibium sp. RKSG952]